LLHGWGGRGAQWVSFIEPLVRAGFTAVALDAPGHGDTRAPRTSILHFAAALSEVVEGLGPAQAVVGHSLGGAAAALALKRGLEAKSAVLVGAPSDPAAFFETFLGRLGVPDRLHGPIRAHVEREYGFEWDDLAVAAPPNQSVPALVVHDAADAEVAASDADRIVAAWPGSELVTTRGLGHQRILRDGDVVRRIVDWIARA
jgi:pimeloyl-ACP methyl ester carboxylesterase